MARPDLGEVRGGFLGCHGADAIAFGRNIEHADAGAVLWRGEDDAGLVRFARAGIDGGGGGLRVPNLVKHRTDGAADALDAGSGAVFLDDGAAGCVVASDHAAHRFEVHIISRNSYLFD